jgi:hypothetical protein
MSFWPWAISTTSRRSLKIYRKNELKIHFEQNFTTGSYEVDMLGVPRKLVKCVVHSSKRKN